MSATDFSPLSSGAGGASHDARRPAERFRKGVGTLNLKPPRGLYIPKGGVTNVRFGDTLPPVGGHTVAQRQGLAFETRVQDVLAAIYPTKFVYNVPILYEDRRGLHRCIPDGILRLDDVSIAIVEIKLTHTERAWWQLEKLYLPVVRQITGPHARIFRAEICRSYDPSVQFPSPHILCQSLHNLPRHQVGVVQWKI